ncbi:uncharacterized protein L3040_008527 [Drepanopeziza brunnea f. sp. 'multigermtubi']|uniref:Proteasome assembly chaperone 3 n=1 Tax=Marssonina brunnea f. sp. multigermtubi (strain MB_m1) TaxID=1072389 RepID=K1WTP3_MARBU|nr:uncharacterized protein MBM_05720 [Drepanopeziza brunnea f. sp. 'multigermtubi' MB_m1]EKD16426.1 hypothetical protein MBM_05720 [Drepanopeziza brunnea f. sp. 'multigermtubi' MB_m1]KAJ5033410.1 hypothetical protein L3040_008527 [Drepanopeziza brunnea f. sp. 'multigermtubi']
MSVPGISRGLENVDIGGGVDSSPFPAKSKYHAGLVSGIGTDVSSIYFSDKILITISQEGRLSQWVQVPLSSASPTSFDTALPSDGEDMLPLGHLTPKTLLGAGGEQRETIGHLYATHIASLIATRNPEDTRTVVVGFGLPKIDVGRDAFFDMLELVQKVI